MAENENIRMKYAEEMKKSKGNENGELSEDDLTDVAGGNYEEEDEWNYHPGRTQCPYCQKWLWEKEYAPHIIESHEYTF